MRIIGSSLASYDTRSVLLFAMLLLSPLLFLRILLLLILVLNLVFYYYATLFTRVDCYADDVIVDKLRVEKRNGSEE